MAEEAEEIQKFFQAKRKKLIFFSFLVLFYELGDVYVAQGPAPFGLLIGNSSIINIFLHLGLLYAFWRFIMAFSRIGSSKLREEMIKNSILHSMEKLAQFKLHTTSSLKTHEPAGRFILEGATSLDKKREDLTASGAAYHFVYATQGHGHQSVEVKIEGAQLWLIKLMQHLIHFFKGGHFLDYYFPLLMFSLALVETIRDDATRSLFNLFNW